MRKVNFYSFINLIHSSFILLKFSIGFRERQGLGGSASFSTLLGVGTLVNFVGELPLHLHILISLI